MTPIGWRLWYADGSVYDSRRHRWEDAPTHGVQVLAVYYAETYRCFHVEGWREHSYRTLYHGARQEADYYWRAGGSFGAGRAGEIPLGAAIKEGTLIANDLFAAVVNEAQREMLFEV